MFKSALFHAQSTVFFAGFFLSAATSNLIRHPKSTLWIDFGILSGVFPLWSRRFVERLRRKVPQLREISYSD